MSHYYFCTLYVVNVAATFFVLDQYAHLFSLTREWKVGKNLISLLYPIAIPYLHTQPIPLNQFCVHIIRKLDQSDLIRAASLKDRFI